jgi:hypothetical protein
VTSLETFWRLIGRVEGLWQNPEYSDSRMMEPVFIELLSCLQKDGVDHDDLVSAVVEVVRGLPKGSDEAVSFCMHVLRWPEVKIAAEDEFKKASGSLMTSRRAGIYEDIIEAFSDDWSGRECYTYFEKQKNT